MVEQYIRESTIDDQRESHSEHRLSSYDCRSIVHLRVRRCLRAVPYYSSKGHAKAYVNVLGQNVVLFAPVQGAVADKYYELIAYYN